MKKDQDNRNDDAACGRLWDIYVKEVQQYDEGMIRSWKEDMDSMLVFSGLYSAILTAFVIESYQNLQPDPAQDSSALLRRISAQLASNSTLPPVPDLDSFTPTTAALTCNILWFASLALALTCAFLATLVQQWSRRFLHRTSAIRSPRAHVHMLQFLYLGLKDLRMHAVVDLIPSLLHLSLFTFFGGLIGFLHDVNDMLTWISSAALSVVILMYIVLTLLPLFKLDSPYATPLSSPLWSLLQICKRIRVLTPALSISPLIRHIRSVGAGNPRARKSIDEEAQREPPDPHTTYGEENVIRSLPALEWSIVDATVKASQLRRVEHESRSIVWSLRSLNDDSELLPFVEALPDVILYEETGNRFRETNFHLLEALVTSTDAQANVILRILDLMDNALSPWHTKSHRERCSMGCARALYALGHVIHANRTRFRPLTHRTPLFNIEIINRIGQGLCCGALDMAYGQSALVLCALSSCLWLRDRLDLELANSPGYLLIIHQLLVIGKIGWEYRVWDDITEKEPSFDHVDPTQCQVMMDGLIGNLLHQYTYGGIENYPRHFEYLSQLIIAENTESLARLFRCDEVLYALAGALDSHKFPESDRDKVDSILRVAIRVSGDGNASGVLETFIPECISSYHQAFGWGGPSLFADPAILSRVLKLLQLREIYQRPLDEHYIASLKHLLAYKGRREEDYYRFWAEIYRDIHKPLRIKSPQELSLTYLIALKAADYVWFRHSDELLMLRSQIFEEILPDTPYPDASPHHLHWITLLQCLGSHLPISHIADILKFFHFLELSTLKCSEVNDNVSFLTLFARYSEEYYLKLVNCSMSEMEQLLEVNGMIWAVWKVLADGLSTETLDECRAWNSVFSLLGRIDGALTPEIREVSHTIVIQGRSPKNPSSAILLPQHKFDEDKRKCLDLPANIEATKAYLTRYRHIFTTLPEADTDEARLLALDDATSSKNDRLAAHYFVQRTSNDEEKASLQLPHPQRHDSDATLTFS